MIRTTKGIIFTEEEENEIKRMYLEDFLSPNKIGKHFNCCETVIKRILLKNGVDLRNTSQTIKFNKNAFDIIDTEEKAYWIGFIWCDGYNCKRIRKSGNPTYEVKISLSEKDINHLNKLNNFLESSQTIKIYSNCRGYSKNTDCNEARLLFSNTYLGKKLEEEYGMIPNRKDCYKVVSKVPNNLMKHFIRGVFDAEGSFSICNIGNHVKFHASITTYESLIDFIQSYLYNNGIIKSINKKYKRHDNRDGECVGVSYCGNNNIMNLLNWMYKDSNIYLDRKYDKYLQAEKLMNNKQ